MLVGQGEKWRNGKCATVFLVAGRSNGRIGGKVAMNKDISEEPRELKTFTENLENVSKQMPSLSTETAQWVALQLTLDQIVIRLRRD
jgi:hypothetical protein